MVSEYLNKEGLVQFNEQILNQIKGRLKYKGGVSLNETTRTNWDDLAAAPLAPKGSYVGHLYKIVGTDGKSLKINDVEYNVGDWIVVTNEVKPGQTGVSVEILGSASRTFIDVEALPTADIKSNVIYRIKEKSYDSVVQRYSLTAAATAAGSTVTAEGITTSIEGVMTLIPFSAVNEQLMTPGSTVAGIVQADAAGSIWRVLNIDGITTRVTKDEPKEDIAEYIWFDDRWSQLVVRDRYAREMETKLNRMYNPAKPNKDVTWATDALGNLVPVTTDSIPELKYCYVDPIVVIKEENTPVKVYFTPVKKEYELDYVMISINGGTPFQFAGTITTDVETYYELTVNDETTVLLQLYDVEGNKSEDVELYIGARVKHSAFFGTVNTGINELEDVVSRDFSITTTLNSDRFIYQYPKDFGLLESINVNGDECINIVNVTEVTQDDVVYYNYTLQLPGNGLFNMHFM